MQSKFFCHFSLHFIFSRPRFLIFDLRRSQFILGPRHFAKSALWLIQPWLLFHVLITFNYSPNSLLSSLMRPLNLIYVEDNQDFIATLQSQLFSFSYFTRVHASCHTSIVTSFMNDSHIKTESFLIDQESGGSNKKWKSLVRVGVGLTGIILTIIEVLNLAGLFQKARPFYKCSKFKNCLASWKTTIQ